MKGPLKFDADLFSWVTVKKEKQPFSDKRQSDYHIVVTVPRPNFLLRQNEKSTIFIFLNYPHVPIAENASFIIIATESSYIDDKI